MITFIRCFAKAHENAGQCIVMIIHLWGVGITAMMKGEPHATLRLRHNQAVTTINPSGQRHGSRHHRRASDGVSHQERECDEALFQGMPHVL